MALHSLERMFNPQRIAVIGVTPNPRSVGGKLLGNLVGGGFRGVVYPVAMGSEAVLGIPCFAGLDRLPRTPDLGVICAPAEQVPDIVRDCGEAGIRGLIIVSAGFRETGEAGRRLEDEIRSTLLDYDGMRVLGPNCLGFISPHRQLNVSFASGMPRPGPIAFISQSGALCSSVLDWAVEEKIGFSCFVSVGNALDIDFADLIDYFGEDEATRSIVLYMESVQRARRFMTAGRAFARSKPIVAYKAGRFPESAGVAASHTGAMMAEDAVYDAAFRRTGMARVLDIGEIFDCVTLIGRQKLPLGPRLGIVTNAGGPGVMAVDALMAENGVLARLADGSLAALGDVLPPAWSHGNPVDTLGDAPPKRIARAVEIVLQDGGVDAVLVILTPQAMTNPTGTARLVAQLAAATAKPVLAAWLGGGSMREAMRLFADAGLPAYSTPERAVRAFMTLVGYARNLGSLYETPRDVPVEFPLDRLELRRRFGQLVPAEGGALGEEFSKTLLRTYGIPVAMPQAAGSAEEAVNRAEEIGFPVVLKVSSPDVSHKSDVGGVVLDLRDAGMVRTAYAAIVGEVATRCPGARVQGVTVQPMVSARHGREVILGIKRDPVFGTVMLAGSGGTAAEVFRDVTLGFPPLNERLARGMLQSLKVWPLLEGYRGDPGVDIDGLVETMIRLSYLAADYPEIAELDINPLLATPAGVTALDARVVVERDAPGTVRKPYDHLALRPYPEEYVRRTEVQGVAVTLRPIRPEDEPLWMELLGSCSRESIYQRFRSFFQWRSHEAAVRYCFIDYDREMAIVAETEQAGRRRLLGVGRLIADPDHEAAEYAVLVADDWQNRGLGNLLTARCLEIAREWGVREVNAQTTSDNPRMVKVFTRLGFEVQPDSGGSLVEVRKRLD